MQIEDFSVIDDGSKVVARFSVNLGRVTIHHCRLKIDERGKAYIEEQLARNFVSGKKSFTPTYTINNDVLRREILWLAYSLYKAMRSAIDNPDPPPEEA